MQEQMEYDNHCIAQEKARKAALANEYGSLYKTAHEKKQAEKLNEGESRHRNTTIYGRLGEQPIDAQY